LNKLPKYRSFIIAVIGTLPLVLSLLPNSSAFAATSRSDISVILVENRNTVKVGQNVTYTAYVTNHGPDDAIAVDVAFSWPSQLNFVSETCDLGISPDSPNCEYLSLAAGQTVVSTFVASPAPGGSNHEKVVKVSANVLFEIDCSFDPNCTFDPNRRNNSAHVLTRVIGKSEHH
jgi:uncharacterized repeat protein (TIGR01451 family)